MSQPSHRKEPHHATSSTASRTRRSALSGLLLVSLVATMFVIQGTGSARADGTVHYVSTNGSDSNPGTIDHPWRTIAHSLVSLRAGDILNIRGGTYVERIMSPSLARGTDLARIRVQNYPNERPVLQGLLWISGAYDWTFSGLNVTWDPARNNRYEHMVKFTNGVGWVFKNAEAFGNLGSQSKEMILNDPGYTGVAGANNTFGTDPQFDSTSTCAGFHPATLSVQTYGKYAPAGASNGTS